MILIESDSLSKRGLKKIMKLNFGPLQHTSCTQSGVRRMVILRKTRRTSKMPSACISQWLEKRPKGGGGQTTLILGCKFKEVEEGAEDQTVQDAYKPKDSLL